MVEKAMTRSNAIGCRWIAGSLVLVTMAQLAMKVGMTCLPAFSMLWVWLQEGQWLHALTQSWQALSLVGAGILAYGVSMWCWLNALRHLPLSRAYPLLSLSYVTVYVAAILTPALHEVFHAQHMVGIAAILLGVALIHRDKPLAST